MLGDVSPQAAAHSGERAAGSARAGFKSATREFSVAGDTVRRRSCPHAPRGHISVGQRRLQVRSDPWGGDKGQVYAMQQSNCCRI